MQKFFVKAISLIGGCMLLSSVAQADPSAIIGLGKISTPQNLAPFYCIVSGNMSGTVYFRDVAVFVTGFNGGGALFITPQQLNKVYFNTYHDPSAQFTGIDGFVSGEITGTNKKGRLVCIRGQGVDRTLEPGGFGVAAQ